MEDLEYTQFFNYVRQNICDILTIVEMYENKYKTSMQHKTCDTLAKRIKGREMRCLLLVYII